MPEHAVIMSSRISGMTWPEDPSRLITDAYTMRAATGVPLLLNMGSFDLWRGSLAQMRGDSPAEVVSAEMDGPNTERFLQTLAVSRALESIPQKCGAVLRLAYGDDGSVEQVANSFEISSRYAADLVEKCTSRLLAAASTIYDDLSFDDRYEAETGDHSPIHLSARADSDHTHTEHK